MLKPDSFNIVPKSATQGAIDWAFLLFIFLAMCTKVVQCLLVEICNNCNVALFAFALQLLKMCLFFNHFPEVYAQQDGKLGLSLIWNLSQQKYWDFGSSWTNFYI